MKNLKELLSEKMRNPEFAREYEIVSEELDLAVQIAKRREQLNMTQQDLATQTGIKQPMIARIERGQIPTVFTLQRIALALKARLVIDAELRLEPKDSYKPSDYIHSTDFDIEFSEVIKSEQHKFDRESNNDAAFTYSN